MRCRYWIAFFTYFAMLYIFEFSLTNYAVGMAMASQYPMKGAHPLDASVNHLRIIKQDR